MGCQILKEEREREREKRELRIYWWKRQPFLQGKDREGSATKKKVKDEFRTLFPSSSKTDKQSIDKINNYLKTICS